MTTVRKRFTTLTNQQLDDVIRNVNRQFPNSRVQEVLGHLRNKNPPIILQRDRCREMLRRIDPVGTSRRLAQAIHRRQYSVPTPNSLWHIDTNHALIR